MTGPTSNPTFVFVPGGWHVAAHYDLLVRELDGLGYAATALTPRTINDSTATPEEDSEQIRQIVRGLLDNGKDVILCSHSGGGVAAAMALKYFTDDVPREDSNGTVGKGSFLGIIWQTAFIIPPGASVTGFYLQSEEKAQQVRDGGVIEGWPFDWQIDKDGLLAITPETAIRLFLTDVSDLAIRQEMAEKVQSTSKISLVTKTPSKSELCNTSYDGRRGFIQTAQDPLWPIPVQDAIIKGSGCEWNVKSISTGHDPFISQPKEMARLLQEYAREYAAL